jgi:WD40 repeat protein
LEGLDTKLPVDGAERSSQKEPWLLHSMDVNALNFCAFAMCEGELRQHDSTQSAVGMPKQEPKDHEFSPILIAVPNALDSGGIDIFHLPSERRVAKISSDKTTTTGMVMALSMIIHPTTHYLILISGYEDGQTIVHTRTHNSPGPWLWKKVLLSKPHSQPLLSVDVSPAADAYYTSSADAIIAKFAVPEFTAREIVAGSPLKVLNTKHAGQQGLVVRSDGMIFATAGWDARVRIYSAKTLKELAVLKWHKEGCYAVAFAQIADAEVDNSQQPQQNTITPQRNALEVIKMERQIKAQRTHWLAASGKDAKISLWDVY